MEANVALAVTRRVIAGLSSETKLALEHVAFLLRDQPNELDLGRGATQEHRGYFFGTSPAPQIGTELPDETKAVGQIVIFTRFHTSEDELERTVLHEIGHVLGKTEEEICASGLGT